MVVAVEKVRLPGVFYVGPCRDNGPYVVAVDGSIVGHLGSRQPGQGGQEIHRRKHFLADAARRHVVRPAHDARHSGSALPGVHLGSPQRFRAAAIIAQGLFDPGPVVGGVDHQRVAVDIQFLECLDDLPQTPIEFPDHVAVESSLRLAAKGLRGPQGHVRHVMGQVEKKRPVLVLGDEANRLAGVLLREEVHVGRTFEHLFVEHQFSYKALGIDLASESVVQGRAEEVVEPLSVWHQFATKRPGTLAPATLAGAR